MRVLVTGANGSVGRELVPALLARGHRVVVLDKDLSALQPLTQPGLELVPGAVEDPRAVTETAGGAEAIIHLAWSFSEDLQVLVEGAWRDETFVADLLLVKHDETYRTPEGQPYQPPT